MQTTLKDVKKSYYWPSIREDIKPYVKNYLKYQKNKHSIEVKVEFLELLPILFLSYRDISIDFITRLSKCSEANSILVIIDRFIMTIRFILMTIISNDSKKELKTIPRMIKGLFFDEQISLYGMPTLIISSKDVSFIIQFCQHIMRKLNFNMLLIITWYL